MIQPTPAQRLQGLVATLAILTLVVGTPLILWAIGVRPWATELSELRQLMTSPDDGTLAMLVLGAAAWISWLVVALSVVVESFARLRGLPAPSLPCFGLPQHGASQLVAVAALLFVAAPTASVAFPPSPVYAVADTPVPPAPELTVVDSTPVLVEAAPVQIVETRTEETTDYTVKRGDSLWRIAERLLGEGARYTEIVDLNRGVLNGRPDFIVAGTVLKVPHERALAPGDEYVVQPGDTLSEIAEEQLGDPLR